MVVFLSAPSKRIVSLLVVGAPFAAFGIAALVASRREFLHDRMFASVRSKRPGAAPVPNPEAFIREVPVLARQFREWAGDRVPGRLVTQVDLEEAAIAVGETTAIDSEMFLPWVATVGEAYRLRTNGRWSVGTILFRGEPVVVSGRFPFFSVRPLTEAIELLEVSSSLQHV